MNAPARIFAAKPATRGEEPLLIGLVGPPGGGKTLSALRLAKGIQSVRGGDIVLIDTESGRSRKYCGQIPFQHVDFAPPFSSADFLAAIQQQLGNKPACIIVDSMSDEHEGEGGYLEYHDEMVGKMGGNEWAAWSKPKHRRKRLITGLLQIKVPLIFTFRAREKTAQNPNAKRAAERIVNIGWQPIAPLEIVHALDLTCILPPKADGVPVWKSDKIGEDFIIKLPNFLQPFIKEGQALSEDMGAAFARWAKGDEIVRRATQENEAPSDGAETGGGSPASVPATDMTAIAEHDIALGKAAEQGLEALKSAYNALPEAVRNSSFIKAAVNRRHKPTAQAADESKTNELSS
jgi:AAA domain